MLKVEAGIYRHFKGGLYYVIGAGTHTENRDRLVAYFDLKSGDLHLRPESMFFEKVFHKGRKRKRFARTLHLESELKRANTEIASHLFTLDSIAADPTAALRINFDAAVKTRISILEKLLRNDFGDEELDDPEEAPAAAAAPIEVPTVPIESKGGSDA